MAQEVKLVGVIVDKALSWQKNTDYICRKATQKLWTIRRLKKLCLDTFTLLDVYKKEVRSILELAVPVWHSGLTKRQAAQIERVQKMAFRVILDNSYTNYETACTLLNLEPLEFRRTQLCINFANKDLRKENSIFTRTAGQPKTRAVPKKVKEPKCRTKRYQNSSIPYLSRLVNMQL